MGAWNCSINGNDTAQDLITEYRCAFFYNDVDVALKKIFDYVCSYLDDDEMDAFVYSLADFMWKKGILTDEIKNLAIKMIDTEYNMEIYKESGEKIYKKRKEILNNFKIKLLSPQPAKKKFSLGMNIKSILNEGDVITFQLVTNGLICNDNYISDISPISKYNGKYVVLRKLYDHISFKSSVEPNVKHVWAIFQILPYYFDNEPELEEVTPLFNYEIKMCDEIETESSLYYFKKKKYKLLGNIKENLKQEYEFDYNKVSSVFFSVDNDWHHPETDIIKKINSLIKKD